MNDDSNIPYWIIEKVSKLNNIFTSPVQNPVRLHKFPQSPRSKDLSQHNSNRNLSKMFKNQFASNLNNFKHKVKKNYFLNKRVLKCQDLPTKLSRVSDSDVKASSFFTSRRLTQFELKPTSLPPINHSPRIVPINSLVSSIKYRPSMPRPKRAESSSESEDYEKIAQDYLQTSIYLH